MKKLDALGLSIKLNLLLLLISFPIISKHKHLELQSY